jgi:hypothetical protein
MVPNRVNLSTDFFSCKDTQDFLADGFFCLTLSNRPLKYNANERGIPTSNLENQATSNA